jgi:hypothetical protein
MFANLSFAYAFRPSLNVNVASIHLILVYTEFLLCTCRFNNSFVLFVYKKMLRCCKYIQLLNRVCSVRPLVECGYVYQQLFLLPTTRAMYVILYADILSFVCKNGFYYFSKTFRAKRVSSFDPTK